MSATPSTTTTEMSDKDAAALVQQYDVQTRVNPIPVVKDGDPREGFFVNIDMSAKGVKQAFKDAGLEDAAGEGAGSYAVWLSTTREGKAVCRLRDATNAIVALPIDALSAGVAGGR